jgi:hypothetical protein
VTPTSAVLLAAIAVAATALGRARFRIGSVRVPTFAPPAGSAASGVRYAFTTAFLPWAKESARRHLPTYLAGLVYHAGIFAMLARLVLTLVVPARLGWLEYDLAALLAASLACGLALLAKRRADAKQRAISVPDDFVANLLVDAALAGAIAAALSPALVPVFQLAGAALLLYAPLGKLRHMLFLLTSRRLWGEYYGRRGVLP